MTDKNIPTTAAKGKLPEWDYGLKGLAWLKAYTARYSPDEHERNLAATLRDWLADHSLGTTRPHDPADTLEVKSAAHFRDILRTLADELDMGDLQTIYRVAMLLYQAPRSADFYERYAVRERQRFVCLVERGDLPAKALTALDKRNAERDVATVPPVAGASGAGDAGDVDAAWRIQNRLHYQEARRAFGDDWSVYL
jgi:hypothetical protein